jgi:hypothetical protein
MTRAARRALHAAPLNFAIEVLRPALIVAGLQNNVSNADFGTISSAYPSRDIQLSMKLQF